MRAAKQALPRVIEKAVISQTIAYNAGITSFYVGRVGEELDRFLNVLLLGGQIGETISLHAATQAAAGDRWACVLCKWLHWTVERDHCPKTLTNTSTPIAAGLRAGAQLVAVATVVSVAYSSIFLLLKSAL